MRIWGKSQPSNSIHALQFILSASFSFIKYTCIVDDSSHIDGAHWVLKPSKIERIVFFYSNVVYSYREGLKIRANCRQYLEGTLPCCVIASYKIWRHRVVRIHGSLKIWIVEREVNRINRKVDVWSSYSINRYLILIDGLIVGIGLVFQGAQACFACAYLAGRGVIAEVELDCD